RGYRAEKGVAPNSLVETHFAARLANARWAGVPFMIHTGKCLEDTFTDVLDQCTDGHRRTKPDAVRQKRMRPRVSGAPIEDREPRGTSSAKRGSPPAFVR
ncbi:MAG: hypothetical protein ACYDB4_11155, partial [Candidatus Dormibacteraceae bacterium]